MQTPPHIAVVVGSTRPTRICPEIAAWTRAALQRYSSLTYETVDLADVALPFLDEPLQAALGRYEHAHTRAWSRLVDSYDGFLFVFPQYNWGYPAVLKNALDFLYQEWRDNPASLVTYGTRGGNRAAEQFDTVLHGLHMRVLDHRIEAIVTDVDLDDAWRLVDVDTTLAPYLPAAAALDREMADLLLGSSTSPDRG